MSTQSSVPAAAETASGRDEGNTTPAGDASAAAGFFVPQPDAYTLGVADWAGSGGALELFVWVDVPERKFPRVIHQVFGLPADPELVDRLFRGPVVIAEKTAQEELFEAVWREFALKFEPLLARFHDARVAQNPVVQLSCELSRLGQSGAGFIDRLLFLTHRGLPWAMRFLPPGSAAKLAATDHRATVEPKSPYLYAQPVSALRVEGTGELTVGGLLALLKNADADMSLPVRLELRKGESGVTYDGDLEGLCVVRQHTLGEPADRFVMLCGRSE